MPNWTLESGYGNTWTITIRNSQSQIVSSYTGTEPLAGRIWTGDDQSPLVVLAPTWNNAAQGTIDVSILPAQSATLGVGLYSVDISLADNSADLFRGLLEVLPSPGSAPPLFSYVTPGQLTTFAGQVGRLFDTVSDQTNFAEQRHQASVDLDRWIMNRYAPQPGRSRRYVDATGSGPGPYLIFAPSPDGSPAPSPATIASYLDTAKLLMNSDLVEAVAHQALAIIYLGQPGRDNPYREAGLAERQLALTAFQRAHVEFDTDGDGRPEIRIDQDVTYLT
jgi:hypothetical protein